jgi:hypothetical protein
VGPSSPLRDKNKNLNALDPNYEVAKFAEDARRMVLRRTLVLQSLDNKADSVKSATA